MGHITECENCGVTKLEFHILDHPEKPKSRTKVRLLKCVGCGVTVQTDEVYQITKPKGD